MSWLPRSLAGFLDENEERKARNEESSGEFWDDPELFQESGKSVKEDLSDLKNSLTQSLWGVASFLAPPPSESVPQKGAAHDAVPLEETGGLSPKLSGIQSDLAELKGGFAKGLSRLSSVIRGDDKQSKMSLSDHDGTLVEAEDTEEGSSDGISKLADGISRLASSFFPFANDEDSDDDTLKAPGLTDEVIAFARDISQHPETWLDFPLASDDDQQNGFEMNGYQKEHAYAIERCALRLAALKVELCPGHMTEGRFWKIYFVLLHSRLSQEDAALLSTPQVLEARKLLVKELRQQDGNTGTRHTEEGDQGISLESANPMVLDKDAGATSVELASAKIGKEEDEADEWLDEEGENNNHNNIDISNIDNNKGEKDGEDVSFSDLEDEEDRTVQNRPQGWVELDGEVKKAHERVGSNEWLTVDKEDVGNGN